MPTPISTPTGSSAPALAIRAERGGPELIDRIFAQWLQLCESTSNEPFYRPEWLRAYARHIAPPGSLLLITVWEQTRLLAVAPFTCERIYLYGLPVRALRSASNWFTNRFDVLRAPGSAGDAAIQQIWAHLRENRNWDAIVLGDVPENANAEALVTLAAQHGYPAGSWLAAVSPYALLEEYASGRGHYSSKRFKKARLNLRRRRTRLAEQGIIEISVVREFNRELLDDFYRLEASGWKGKNKSDIISRGKRAFFDDVAAAAAEADYFILHALKYDGRPVAAHLGLLYRGRYFVPKLAYDEKFSRYSPGLLLLENVFSDCAARGVLEFDFLGDVADYKTLWAPHFRKHYYHYIFAPTFYGRLLHRTKFSFVPAAKNLLRRLFPAHGQDQPTEDD